MLKLVQHDTRELVGGLVVLIRNFLELGLFNFLEAAVLLAAVPGAGGIGRLLLLVLLVALLLFAHVLKNPVKDPEVAVLFSAGREEKLADKFHQQVDNNDKSESLQKHAQSGLICICVLPRMGSLKICSSI